MCVALSPGTQHILALTCSKDYGLDSRFLICEVRTPHRIHIAEHEGPSKNLSTAKVFWMFSSQKNNSTSKHHELKHHVSNRVGKPCYIWKILWSLDSEYTKCTVCTMYTLMSHSANNAAWGTSGQALLCYMLHSPKCVKCFSS